MNVDPGVLGQYLSITDVTYIAKNRSLAVIDSPLGVLSSSVATSSSNAGSATAFVSGGGYSVSIDNFTLNELRRAGKRPPGGRRHGAAGLDAFVSLENDKPVTSDRPIRPGGFRIGRSTCMAANVERQQ